MPRASSRAPKPARSDPSALIFNGVPLVKNDHIYVSAPWDERDGEPYLVARILEILQPSTKALPSATSASNGGGEGTTTSTSSSKASTPNPQPRLNGPEVSRLRLRVNYYFRTRDISNRYVADHRVLVASFHSDVVPAEYVRGVCTVKHREHIEDLDRYKRMPDTFYWHQLYDRYLHRYFDTVPTYKVKNAPAEIVRHLVDNFEFVLCEVGTGAELCDAQRGCCVCSRWAANPESVTCARCARVFHLTCVDPPLAAKPKAGYGWSCAPCSKAHDEEVESYAEAGLGPPPIRKAAEGGRGQFGGYDPKAPQMLSLKGKGKAKEVQEGVRTDARDWHMTNGWPFRYFGMHTNAYNVLDPHDSLFPRARTRLGNKFQCVVPEWDDAKKQQVESVGEQRVYFQPKRSRASTPMGRGGEGGGGEGKGEKDAGLVPVKKKAKGKQAELLPRGEEDAVNVIWRPTDKFDDATLDELFREAKTLKMYRTAGVDLLNRACQLIVTHEGDVSSTIAALRKVTLSSMGHATWTEEEKRKLVEGAEQHNNDIEEIAAGIPTKKMGDVVKRYYIHIGHNRQEDEATQPEEKVAAATRSVRQAPQPSASTSSSAVTYTSSGRRTRRVARAEADEEADLLAATAAEDDADKADDNGSVCNIPASTPAQRRNRFCAVCGEDESEKWYFCPENISELEVKPNPLVMCESCGIRWRHYGAQYPPYGDELKPLPAPKQPSKKELDRIAAEEAARRKEEEEQAELEAALLKAREPTPPPPKPVIPPKPCLLCKRFEPKTSLFQCDNCTLSVHTSCYGLPEGDWPYEEWLCDLCEREKMRKPLVLHPHCILCPPPVKEEEPKEGPPNPLTALELLKPTGLSNYVHLLCAVWHRELLLGEPSLVSPVEGFTLLPKKRITDTCSICLEKEVGCTVKCEDCDKHFHVACAWSLGYKFAFEIQAVRKKRPPKDVVSVKFKEEEGVILPCIWCPDHHFSHSERKTYDIGARDQATKLTALQMYVRTTKAPKNPDAPLPLRLGRRLDTLVEPVLKPKEPTPPPPPPRRKPRASLLTAIIEELPPPGSRAAAAKSAPRKGRRTQSMTPMQDLVYEPPELPQYFTPPGQQPEPDQDMSMDQDVHLAMLDEVASTPAEDAPLPAKRVRKQPKRFEPESPQTKPKGSKKRRTGSYAPNDRLSSTNGYYDESSLPLSEYNVDPANFGQHLPPLPASSSSLPSLPVPDLPPLPNFASNLPALPNFGSNQQAGAFADAFYPNDMADAASFLYPSFSGLPSLPQLEQSGGSIDPALEALTAVAAAAAEARLEAPEGAPVIDQTGPTPEEVEAFMQSLPDGPVAAPEPDAEPSNGAAAPEAAQPSPQPQPEPEPVPAPEPEPQPEVKPEPNQQPEPNGIAVPDESEETMDGVDAEVKENGAEGKEVDGEAAENDSEPVERSGETEQVEAPQQEEADQATTSEAPAAEIPATAAPVPASAPPTQNAPPPQPAPSSAAPSSSAAGPTPLPLPLLPSQPDTRHNSPSAASFDGLNVHPILNYVRAHEASSLGRDFRIDTPDDSDAASDRVDSPAPGSGLNSPAAFAQHQALDFAALAGAAAAAAGASSQAGPSHSAVPSTSHGSFAQQQQSTVTPQGKRRRPSVKGQASPAICSNCGTTDSPLFRRDDQGRQLCNSCGLYYKTHGTDRPQKVIARAIGAARVQKRKAQAGTPDDGASTTSAASPSGSGSAYQYKRPKTSGTPLPLMQMPPLSFDASEHLAGGSGSPAQGDGAYLASQGYSSPYGQLPVPPPPPARSSSSTSSAGGGRGSVPPLPRLPPPPPGMAQPQHPAYGALPPLPPSIGNGRPSDPFSLPPLPTPPPLPALPGGTSNGGAAPPLPLPPLQEQQLPPLTGQGQGQGGEGNGALGLFAQAADQAERLRRSGADGEEGGQGGGEEKKRESRGGDEKAA